MLTEQSNDLHAAAKAHLENCLALAGDCPAIYMSIDNSLRRIANQAFFERISVRAWK